MLSNADPKRTFLSLIDEGDLASDLVSGVRRLKTDVSYLKFHAALDELPDFTGYLGGRYDENYLVQVRICPSVEYFQQSADDARAGRPSTAPVMHIQIPSVLDKTLTPEGKHVMSIWVLYAPVRPYGESWDNYREQAGEQLIDKISEYAPGFRQSVRDWELFTPQELEERVGLTDGNIRHLDITSLRRSRPTGQALSWPDTGRRWTTSTYAEPELTPAARSPAPPDTTRRTGSSGTGRWRRGALVARRRPTLIQ